jgi:two-component system chemotaxis sensor kinase CheA
MNPSVDVNEFLEGFLTEAEEHLHGITVQLSSIDQARDRPNPRAVRELFRSLHTLKGLAGMMGIEPIVVVAHAMESVVRVADKASGLLPANSLDPLIAGKKTLEQCVRALAAQTTVAPPSESLLSALEASVQAPAQTAPSPGAPRLADAGLASKLTAAELAEVEQALANGESAYAVEFIPSPARGRGTEHHDSAREDRPRRAHRSRAAAVHSAERGGARRAQVRPHRHQPGARG